MLQAGAEVQHEDKQCASSRNGLNLHPVDQIPLPGDWRGLGMRRSTQRVISFVDFFFNIQKYLSLTVERKGQSHGGG